jgi:hypothetical protein
MGAALIIVARKARYIGIVFRNPFAVGVGLISIPSIWGSGSKRAKSYGKLKRSNLFNYLRLSVQAVISDENVRCAR